MGKLQWAAAETTGTPGVQGLSQVPCEALKTKGLKMAQSLEPSRKNKLLCPTPRQDNATGLSYKKFTSQISGMIPESLCKTYILLELCCLLLDLVKKFRSKSIFSHHIKRDISFPHRLWFFSRPQAKLQLHNWNTLNHLNCIQGCQEFNLFGERALFCMSMILTLEIIYTYYTGCFKRQT